MGFSAKGHDRDALTRQLDEQGYCVIPGALEPKLLTHIQCRLREQALAECRLHNLKNPANTDPINQWVGMLLNKGDVFLELVSHRVALSLIEHVLGAGFLISCVDSQIQHPNSVQMPLHTDQWWVPPPVALGESHVRPASIRRGTGTTIDASPSQFKIAGPMVANVMWMISDFSEENGATRVVPGSHLSGKQPDPSIPHPVDTVAAVGRAGTAFVFDGRLWHGADPKSHRLGALWSNNDILRAAKSATRKLHSRHAPGRLGTLPPDVRARLGFKTWSSYGHTGDPDTDFTGPGFESIGELKP